MAEEEDQRRTNAGLLVVAEGAMDRLAELSSQYVGDGRVCSHCREWKEWEDFGRKANGKNVS